MIQQYRQAITELKEAQAKVCAFFNNSDFQNLFISAICRQMDWKPNDVTLNSFDNFSGKIRASVRHSKDNRARYVFRFTKNSDTEIIPVLEFREEFV